MNLEKQRIKILEFLGWRDLYRKGFALRGTSPQGKENQIAPNPLVNLNVMHEAEKKLNAGQINTYVEYLYSFTKVAEVGSNSWDIIAARMAIHTTATQRSEAFLKTLNLWEQ